MLGTFLVLMLAQASANPISSGGAASFSSVTAGSLNGNLNGNMTGTLNGNVDGGTVNASIITSASTVTGTQFCFNPPCTVAMAQDGGVVYMVGAALYTGAPVTWSSPIGVILAAPVSMGGFRLLDKTQLMVVSGNISASGLGGGNVQWGIVAGAQTCTCAMPCTVSTGTFVSSACAGSCTFAANTSVSIRLDSSSNCLTYPAPLGNIHFTGKYVP